MTCTKRTYASEEAAKAAHHRAGYRLRVYRCNECGDLHTTNADKTPRQDWQSMEALRRRKAGMRSRRRLGLAPVLTLEQVEALAAQKRAAYAG